MTSAMTTSVHVKTKDELQGVTRLVPLPDTILSYKVPTVTATASSETLTGSATADPPQSRVLIVKNELRN